MRRTAIVVCFSALVALPANAQWESGREGDTCGISMEYEGEGATKLMIVGDGETDPIIHITNYNWTAKKDEKYTIQYHMGGYYYEIPSIGVEFTGARKGFATYISDKFVDDFARSPSIQLQVGDKLIDDLKLDGSGAAIAKFRACIRVRKAEIAKLKADDERLKHIPKDPFAEQCASLAASVKCWQIIRLA